MVRTEEGHSQTQEPGGVDAFLGWLMGLGGIVGTAVRLGDIPAQLRDFSSWWNLLCFAAVAALIILVCLGPRADPARLRVFWIAVPVLVLAAQLTSFGAYAGADVHGVLPWVWAMEPVAVSLTVLLVRPAVALGYAFFSALTPLFSGVVFLGVVPQEVLVQTPVHVSNFAFIVIFIGIRGRLQRLHEVETAAHARVTEEIRMEVQAAKRDEMARVMHDEVMSTLIAAMRLPGHPSTVLRQAAADSRRVLREATSRSGGMPADSEEPPESGVLDVQLELATITERIAPGAHFDVTITEGSLPAVVSSAFAHATAEALRNSIRHAPGTARWVTGELGADSIEVRIRDDGPGFRIRSVDPRRMGVRLSITGRMHAVGGRSRVDTGLDGTSITLEWARDRHGRGS